MPTLPVSYAHLQKQVGRAVHRLYPGQVEAFLGSDVMAFTEWDIPDQSGRVIAVTGANTGLGFQVSRLLATRGAQVLMACRSRDKAEGAMQRIWAEVPDAALNFVPLDLADLDSVREGARQIAARPRLDVLINNAGLMMTPFGRTAQDVEMQVGVNHLGPFALTALLAPALEKTIGARVVVTSSIAHRRARMDWDTLGTERRYRRRRAYYTSKLANALFLVELDRRLRAAGSLVVAVGCHPGVARTDLFRHIPLSGLFDAVVGPFLNSDLDGALPTLLAATGPVEPGGYYGPVGFREVRGKAGKAVLAPQARDLESARRLWDWSVRTAHIDFPPPVGDAP
jgi:NAD(P)-dependent dehydrogenase (short-subunit alcohol dehydrogenase family)